MELLLVSVIICGTYIVSCIIGNGIDYVPGPYNITIPAGVTIVDFSFSVINDNILEDNESFTLIIDSHSLPDGISGGIQTVVTIVDDDSKCLIFLRHVNKLCTYTVGLLI